MKNIILILIIFFSLCPTDSIKAVDDENELARRIQNHLIIHDYRSACEEGQEAVKLFPKSSVILEAYIRALAKFGDEKATLAQWEHFSQLFHEKATKRDLIEEIAWGVLYKASQSSSFIMRQMAMLAAFFSREMKGITLLHLGMQDSNYSVRKAAVQLAGHFPDNKLTKEMKRLFREEKVWAVREEVLQAIGQMKIVELQTELEAIIASEKSLAKEKAIATSSLLELFQTINRQEIDRLSHSSRVGLRKLACQAIALFQSERDLDVLYSLAKDPHPDVRFDAFQAIGQLRPINQDLILRPIIDAGIKDSNDQVIIAAAWVQTLYDPVKGQKVLERYLSDSRTEIRYLAVAALNAAGQYGMPLALEQFHLHNDPYIRLNLALGLLDKREVVNEAADYISQMILKEKEIWFKRETGMFHAIVKFQYQTPSEDLNSPENENQLIRLEMLNLLAILKIPMTQDVIRKYLLARDLEISSSASALLLTNGDESAVKLVEGLLQDPQPRVRIQAALVLSLWSHEETPIKILEEGFLESDWDYKARILEGLGRIGSMRSVPFLMKVLKEPSQTLRLIAAMALIQCLNH